MALSRILVEQFGGEVPRDRDPAGSASGIGRRKTANVVLNVAFGEPTDRRRMRTFSASPTAPGLSRAIPRSR